MTIDLQKIQKHIKKYGAYIAETQNNNFVMITELNGFYIDADYKLRSGDSYDGAFGVIGCRWNLKGDFLGIIDGEVFYEDQGSPAIPSLINLPQKKEKKKKINFEVLMELVQEAEVKGCDYGLGNIKRREFEAAMDNIRKEIKTLEEK